MSIVSEFLERRRKRPIAVNTENQQIVTKKTLVAAEEYMVEICRSFNTLDALDKLLRLPFVDQLPGARTCIRQDFEEYGTVEIIFINGETEPLCARIVEEKSCSTD